MANPVNRYDLLEALIDVTVETEGDPAGWHHVVVSVLRAISDAELVTEDGSELPSGALINVVFERIASALIPKSGGVSSAD